MKLEVLYEDEYLTAVVKPPGISSEGDRSNGEDMVSIVKNYIFDRSDMDSEPYLAVINRLDKPVGGIMLFGRTKEVAAKLSDMIQMKQPGDDAVIRKYYQAVLDGYLENEEGTYEDYILFDKKKNVSKIVPEGTKGAKKAILHYELLDEFETDSGYLTYVLIELFTGRHHQIRCQMAHHGTPIHGDAKYGNMKIGQAGKPKGSNGKNMKNGGIGKEKSEIALYSSRLEFIHPVTGERIVLKKEPDTKAFEAIELDEF